MLLTFVTSTLIATGSLAIAGFVLAISGLCDVLDGATSRAKHQSAPFGAFLDSTLDRYSDALILAGAAAFFLSRHDGFMSAEILGSGLAMLGSLLVSYTRASAEAAGFECSVGAFGRPERLITLIVGLLFGSVGLLTVVALLAVVTNVTAVQRFVHVWAQSVVVPGARSTKT